MKDKNLKGVFIPIIISNSALIITIAFLVFRNIKLGQREIYRIWIMLFITSAYLLRIIQLIYLLGYYQGQTYNRPRHDWKHNKAYSFLTFAPVVLHGLAGLSYLSRWIHYYLLTKGTAKNKFKKGWNSELKLAIGRQIAIHRIIFTINIVISLSSIPLYTFFKDLHLAILIFLIGKISLLSKIF